jgi:vancomycin resistance protein YoaR
VNRPWHPTPAPSTEPPSGGFPTDRPVVYGRGLSSLVLFTLIVLIVAVAAALRPRVAPRGVVIAAYATSLRGRTPDQAANIRRAAAALDGVMLPPGGTFSMERALGPVTSESGYRRALAIRDGEPAEEDGGGICQVASTLYNAALRANLTILERQRHLWPVHSVPPGLDCGFASGHLDLKFRNPTDQPLLLRVTTDDRHLLCRVVGERPLKETVRVERVVRAVLPPESVVRATPRLHRGRQRLAQHGRPGWEVDVWRVTRRPGDSERRTLVSRDRYAPVNRVLWVGTR